MAVLKEKSTEKTDQMFALLALPPEKMTHKQK